MYLKDVDGPDGLLVLDGAGGGTGNWTPLGVAGTDRFVVAEATVIRGNGTRVRPEHAGMELAFGQLTLEGGAYVESEALLTVTQALTLDGAALVARRMEAGGLWLTNTAGLTTFSGTADRVCGLTLDVEGAVVVDTTSMIDVSGKGYLPGYTTGNTTVSGASGQSGGSFGGLGGN